MPELSEFIKFVAVKSGIKDLSLIEKDIVLHRILMEMHFSALGEKYLFKGGSCLVKCFFGYYRFSVDLDFTWRDQHIWRGLGKKRLREKLIGEIKKFGLMLEKLSKEIDLDFETKLDDKRYVEFGGGGRMVTFKLWKNSELIKIQVNFIEKILFKAKMVLVKTLLSNIRLKDDESSYFKDFLDFYKPFYLYAYDEREILCEKVRAILTRRVQKLRDFYDLFILHKHGLNVEDFMQEIGEKVGVALYYKKYRETLKKNKKRIVIEQSILENPFERSLFVVKPAKEFDIFLKSIIKTLKNLLSKIDIYQ